MIYWKNKILCFKNGIFYYRSPVYIKNGDIAVMVNVKTLKFHKKKIVDVHKIRNYKGFRVRTEHRFIDTNPANYFLVKREDGLIKLLRLSQIKKTDEFVFKLMNKNKKGYMISEKLLSVVADTAYSRFYDVIVEKQQVIDVFVANNFLLGILRKG